MKLFIISLGKKRVITNLDYHNTCTLTLMVQILNFQFIRHYESSFWFSVICVTHEEKRFLFIVFFSLINVLECINHFPVQSAFEGQILCLVHVLAIKRKIICSYSTSSCLSCCFSFRPFIQRFFSNKILLGYAWFDNK